jgi:phage tail tape-measure protein
VVIGKPGMPSAAQFEQRTPNQFGKHRSRNGRVLKRPADRLQGFLAGQINPLVRL